MMNGCICCTVRADLEVVLEGLAFKKQNGLKLDGVIIETTGMADPAPVAQTFFLKESIEKNSLGMVTMMNGCICCTVRADLEVVLEGLAFKKQNGLKLDGVIIETTGMADPAPVAQTFFLK